MTMDVWKLLMAILIFGSIIRLIIYLENRKEKKRLGNMTEEEKLQEELDKKQKRIEAEEARLMKEVKDRKIAEQEAYQERLRVAEFEKLNAEADARITELEIS